MNAELTTTFAAAVREAVELPEQVRSAADRAVGVELGTFDYTDIEFLVQQIELAPRGPAWTERLKRRRGGLLEFCGHRLILGRIIVNRDECWIRADPRTGGGSLVGRVQRLDSRSPLREAFAQYHFAGTVGVANAFR
jgi:hypothetical protein